MAYIWRTYEAIFKRERTMSDESFFINEYKKYKQQIEDLEKADQGESKNCAKLRQMLINVWNKMTPPQQREIAVTYIPD